MPEFDTNNNGYSELQPQYSTSHGQQQEQRYHWLCGQYGHSRSSYIGCPHYQPRPPPPGDSDEPEPLPRPQPTEGYGFRISAFTKPACESVYVHRTSKTTFMLASLFSPSAVYKPPDSYNYICNVWLKRFAIPRYTQCLRDSSWHRVSNFAHIPV
jgi:hypothetical protein